jgi:molybdenum cofactor cytidylyltransferase
MRRARTSPRARAGAAAGRPRRAAIGVILLAAGGSSRMGRPKQALRIAQRDVSGEGESLLRHAARAAVESAARPVVVVLGATADSLTSDIADLPIHAVGHSGWARGIGSSIKIGLECLTALAPATDGVIISVCDQPHLSAAVLSRLGRAYRGSDAHIVASAYSGIAGVPALFDRAVFSELHALRDHDGARALIEREAERVVTVPFPLGAIDLDTPEAYEEYLGARR